MEGPKGAKLDTASPLPNKLRADETTSFGGFKGEEESTGSDYKSRRLQGIFLPLSRKMPQIAPMLEVRSVGTLKRRNVGTLEGVARGAAGR